MRRRVLFLGICLLCMLPVRAAEPETPEVPQELLECAPEAAEVLETPGDFLSGTEQIGALAREKLEDAFQERIRGAAAVLLVAVLVGLAESVTRDSGNAVAARLPLLAGALSVTALTAGSLDTLMGLGRETIRELQTFSDTLLPALAAAAAAGGAVSSASLQQVAAVLFADLLLRLMDGVLLPLTYLHVGALTAATILPGDRLQGIAGLLKKLVTGTLTVSMLAFTLYLSVAHIVTGTADALTVKVTRTAVSTVVPVVGSILSDASETVLAGAGMLRNTIGVFGMLAVLAACIWPFAQLGVQYLLYRAAGLLAGVAGAGELGKLIEGLGGAFGMVLGMTGACAVTLLVSILASISAVTG